MTHTQLNIVLWLGIGLALGIYLLIPDIQDTLYTHGVLSHAN